MEHANGKEPAGKGKSNYRSSVEDNCIRMPGKALRESIIVKG